MIPVYKGPISKAFRNCHFNHLEVLDHLSKVTVTNSDPHNKLSTWPGWKPSCSLLGQLIMRRFGSQFRSLQRRNLFSHKALNEHTEIYVGVAIHLANMKLELLDIGCLGCPSFSISLVGTPSAPVAVEGQMLRGNARKPKVKTWKCVSRPFKNLWKFLT